MMGLQRVKCSGCAEGSGKVLDSPSHMKLIPSDEGASASLPGKVV